MPLPALGAILALTVEIVGSLALLAVFTLLASVFWAISADRAFVTQLLFFKNIAVVGGLLALAANGAGA